jgi:hypothetical protein
VGVEGYLTGRAGVCIKEKPALGSWEHKHKNQRAEFRSADDRRPHCAIRNTFSGNKKMKGGTVIRKFSIELGC